MADIKYLSRLSGALLENLDISTNTLLTLSIKVGGSPYTELTKTILDRLTPLQNGTDVDSSYHTHNTLYFLKTQMVSTTPGSAGSTLIGDDGGYINFSPSAATVKGALTGIDSALGSITAVSALDATFRIKNSSDQTKRIAFSASSLTTGTTRTITMPDAEVDLAQVNTSIQQDGTRPFTADQSMGSHKIINLADGSLSSDAVTYGQLTSLSLGLVWQGPIDDPDLVDDSLSTPPGSPSFSLLYIIAAAPTGAWTGLAGHAVWWDGAQWIDLSTGNLATSGFGTAVQVGARFLVAAATNGASGHVGGTFAGGTYNGQVATVTTNTPGSFTYSFATPLNNWAVSDLFAGSQHANNSFVYATSAPFVFTVTAANATAGATYTNNGFTFTVTSTIVGGLQLLANGTGFPSTSGTLTKTGGTGDATITFSSFTGSTWINFAGPSKNAAGVALAYAGNTLNVLTDGSSIDTNGSNQLELKNNGTTNAKLAQMATKSLKGNNTGGSANASDLTVQQVNAMLFSLTSTATSGGTLTLSATDSIVQQLTGTSSHTVVLPDATTLLVGDFYVILNRSTGSITVNKNGGSNVTTITAGNWGIFRVTDISTSAGVWDNGNNLQYSSIYDQRVTVVSGAPVGNQITGPVTPGTNVTLPSSQTYNSSELQIYLNGQRLEVTSDWNTVGSVPRTQVTFVDTLQVGDTIDFVIERNF